MDETNFVDFDCCHQITPLLFQGKQLEMLISQKVRATAKM